MRKLVASVLEDLSTREVFLFRVSCAGCATQYTSKPVRFSKAGSTADETLLDALYSQEQETAQRCAVRNAAEHMNYCPICKRIVCNRCFLICDDLDMCRQCADALNQKGMPVAADIVDAAT